MLSEEKISNYDLYLQKVLTWIRKTSGLQKNIVKFTFLEHQLFDGGDSCVFDAAAQAAIGKLQKLFRVFCSGIIC